MRAALTLALRHLDYLPLPASHPFYLVAFKGRALDENGATTAANGSDWEFVFTRYAEAIASQRYEYASIVVPGIGVTRLSRGVSEDAAMSPIENWDAAEDGSSPDSFDMLTPFKAKGLPAAGATMVLSRGLVTIQAGGKSTTFNTLEGSYTPIQ